MNTKEKAKAGVQLLKEAVLEFIEMHPDGVTPSETRDQIDLNSPDENGDFKDTLLWGIGNILRVEELIDVRKVNRRNRFFRVNKSATQS